MPVRSRRRISSSKELVEWLRLAATGSSGDGQYELATVTSIPATGGIKVAFDGDIDDSLNPIETAVAFSFLQPFMGSVGSRVIMLKKGATWICMGLVGTVIATPGRTKTIVSPGSIGSGVYVSNTVPPSSTWHTRGTGSGGSGAGSRVTLLQDCIVNLGATCYHTAGVQATAAELIATLPAGGAGWYGDTGVEFHGSVLSQLGGGQMYSTIQFTALMRANEGFDFNVRNLSGGTDTLTLHTHLEFIPTPIIDG